MESLSHHHIRQANTQRAGGPSTVQCPCGERLPRAVDTTALTCLTCHRTATLESLGPDLPREWRWAKPLPPKPLKPGQVR